MKKILKFFLYLFLLLFFLVILAGTGYWILIVQGWPWWVFAVIAGSAAGVILGFFAIKKFLVRRNEKQFVQRVIKEEEATAQQAPEEEKYKLKEMQTQWKLTIDKLQKSHLRRKGNPLYVLPWYMVIGEERTGKTSAIKNSNLSSPLTDVSQAATISGTKNCDWWFFDQAIILDTAGRYTIPVDESPDKKEWQTFLTLLSKYRKKEPLNGVIVAVASDTLLNENDVSLSEKGRNIRQRINQLMRILGARFPVYLLVTKMDLVNGFTDFCDHIPEQRENQVMGYSNKEKNPDCMQVLENCITTVFSNLKKLRTIFIQNRINHFAVSFPTEFLRLKPGLASYVRSLFGEDIYQATPLFRGIYFSSACRQGTPESQFLKTTGIKYSSEDSKEGNKGYFLKNFFQAVLPGDRNIFTPLTEFIMWRKTTISLGFFSLMLVCIAFCGILTFSYHNNVKALNSYNNTLFNNNPLASGKTDNILMLDRQRFEIDQLEYSNDNWILPRLGLNHSLVLEERLKQRYLKNVRENLIKPLDTIFFDAVDRINSNTLYTDIVDYAVYAVRRINVLKSSFNNEVLSGEDQFGKSVGILFPKIDKTIPSAIASKFSPVYYDYLKWDDNENNRVLKLNEFQNQLSKIADKSGSFHWLVSRAVCRANDITLADFFKGYDVNQKQFSLRVNGAYTKAGRDEIHEFVEIIGKAFQSEEEFIQMENRFWAWYAIEFYRTWYAFAVGFPKGKDWKSVTENWLDAGTLMATEHNPYFMLLDLMAEQFNLFQKSNKQEPVPVWASTVIRLKHIKELALTEKKKEKGSLLAKISLQKDKISKKILGSKGTKVYKALDRKKAADIDYDFLLAKKWNEYVDSLKTLSPATLYNEKCYHMFSDFFSVLSDPSKQEKPFNLVYSKLLELETFFQQNEVPPEVFRLIKGPFDFFMVYGVYSTVEYLQEKWEETVLSASYSVDPEKYYSIMFDKNSGLIWKYVNEYAAPFIDQNRTGFFPKKAFGANLPFFNSFFRLLNKGEKLSLEQQNEYIVSIQNLPVNVNRTAGIRPYSSILTLECADEKIELVNNNFPESEEFKWKPATCGDVTLSIMFKDITLKKSYKGRMGFAQFLSDFQDGKKIFNVSDFPDNIGHLTNNGVSDIFVSYEINGIEPVLNFLNRVPPEIPDLIFKNIKQKSGKYPVAQKKIVTPEKKDKKSTQIEKLIKLNKKFKITMETIPMEINASADIKPVAGIFWMNCNDNVVRFENNNYPETITFEWDPLKCGKVLLLIHFPKITLLKEYQDFLEFIEDFNYHSHTFSCNDFPEQKEELLKNNISSIKLTYNFTGDLPFLETKNIKEKTLDNQPIAENVNIIVAPDYSVMDKENQEIDDGPIKTKAWILKQSSGYYTIQTMMGHVREKTIAFAINNRLNKNSAIYKTHVKGQARYNLIYGSYESYSQAEKALTELSDAASRFSPFIRKFASIHKVIE